MNHADHVALIRDGVTGAGRRWLELGAGDGAFTLALADVLGPDGSIVAVDRDRHRPGGALESAHRAVSGRRRRDAARRLHAGAARRAVRRRARGQQPPLRPRPAAAAGGDPRRAHARRPPGARGVRRGSWQPVGPVPDLVRPLVRACAGGRVRAARRACTACPAGSWTRSTARRRRRRACRHEEGMARRRRQGRDGDRDPAGRRLCSRSGCPDGHRLGGRPPRRASPSSRPAPRRRIATRRCRWRIASPTSSPG